MGNCLSFSRPAANPSENSLTLPIQTMFKLPSPIPTFPPAVEGFASGTIDLGGLQVCQISSFTKVWATHEGGPDNLGATFFEPSPIPQGFFMLGCYSQPNNKPLFGWVLAGKDVSSDPSVPVLKNPIDYSLIWNSESLKIKQDGNINGYVWLPTPPDGYKAVGHVVTVTPKKPSLDKIRCVRSDLTDQCETDMWIWGQGNGFSVFGLRPSNTRTQSEGVCVGTFVAQKGQKSAVASPLSLACLKNMSSSVSSSMPNLSQIETLVKGYSPRIYFHPDDQYQPSSVSWFFKNGALLYKKGAKSGPIKIESMGSNLPQGSSDDDAYWLDLPVDKRAKEQVKKGDLDTSEVYVHVKPMLGATFTDIAIWVFYPFNGPARLKIGGITIPLGRMGEHIGDWEHVTLRISNFNGQLWSMYMSAHSGGTRVNASELEFENDNKPVIYASLNGHAFYPKPGLVLQGFKGIGIGLRNDTVKTDNTTEKKKVMDSGERFSIVAAKYLGLAIVEPPWLNYYGKWGPKLSPKICCKLEGNEGPIGPKVKKTWNEDEVVHTSCL